MAIPFSKLAIAYAFYPPSRLVQTFQSLIDHDRWTASSLLRHTVEATVSRVQNCDR